MPVPAELAGVEKRLGPNQALAGVDLVLREGEVLALLGPNGAGKSTAVGILLGLRRPDAGTARVFGRDPRLPGARRPLGSTPQDVSFPPTLQVREVITLVRASDVTIHAVGFLEHQPSSSRLMQRQRLAEIAETTGGQAFFPTAMKDVEAAYDKIVAQIRNQYTIGYTSSNAVQDGKWRKVDVKIARPDLKDTRIQSRRGYFALYKDGQ